MEKYSNFLEALTELGLELKLNLGSSEWFLELFLFTLKVFHRRSLPSSIKPYQKRTAKTIVKINYHKKDIAKVILPTPYNEKPRIKHLEPISLPCSKGLQNLTMT